MIESILVSELFQVVESAGIKFPDFKNSGVSLRSQRIKLPSSLGQKKMKSIEQMLTELHLGECRKKKEEKKKETMIELTFLFKFVF